MEHRRYHSIGNSAPEYWEHVALPPSQSYSIEKYIADGCALGRRMPSPRGIFFHYLHRAIRWPAALRVRLLLGTSGPKSAVRLAGSGTASTANRIRLPRLADEAPNDRTEFVRVETAHRIYRGTAMPPFEDRQSAPR